MYAETITVILPTYRRPQLLKRAIASVLAQTYPHFLLYIYDNASGDETEEVVRAFQQRDSRIHYHRHPENIGSLANFAYGIERVQTPYFSVFSDDDHLLPTLFATALATYRNYPDAGIVALSQIERTEEGRVIHVGLHTRKPFEYYPAPEGTAQVFQSDFPAWTSILYATHAVRNQKPYLTSNFFHDVYFNYQIAYRSGIALVNQPGAIYTHHAACFSAQYSHRKRIENLHDVLRLLPQVGLLPSALESQVNVLFTREFFDRCLHSGLKSLALGDLETAAFALDSLSTVKPRTPSTRLFRSLYALQKAVPSTRYALASLLRIRKLLKRWLLWLHFLGSFPPADVPNF